MKEKNIRTIRGITLISLVITIIILLILAGITISSLTNTGLFGRAKEAKEKTQAAEANQAKTLNEYEDEISKYLPKEDNDPKIVDKVDDETVKVGDYVKYTPNTASQKSISDLITLFGQYSGSEKNTSIVQDSFNWRVLDVKDGQVRLISDKPTTSKIEFASYNGYNNAVYLLDNACKVLYGNSNLASKAQNLKREDILSKMTKDGKELDENSYYGTQFSPTDTIKYYPEILLQEKGTTVNNNSEGNLKASSQDALIEQTKKMEVSNISTTYTHICSYDCIDESNFHNSKYVELFKTNGGTWLSTRAIRGDGTDAEFHVCILYDKLMDGTPMYNTKDYKFESLRSSYSLRPVITLNTNVKIDLTSGDGSSAEQAYTIK